MTKYCPACGAALELWELEDEDPFAPDENEWFDSPEELQKALPALLTYGTLTDEIEELVEKIRELPWVGNVLRTYRQQTPSFYERLRIAELLGYVGETP